MPRPKKLDLSKKKKSSLEVKLPDGKNYALLDSHTITVAITLEMTKWQEVSERLQEDDNPDASAAGEMWANVVNMLHKLIPDAPSDVLMELTNDDVQEIMDFFAQHAQSASKTGSEPSQDSPDSTE